MSGATILPQANNSSDQVRTTATHHRLSTYLEESLCLASRLLELELFLLALAIGIQDAISFPDFHCFASNQTGNTVLFAVGVLLDDPSGGEPPMFAISTLAVSLSFFIIGVFVTGQIANRLAISQTRGWLFFSGLGQTVLVIIAGALQLRYSELVGPNTKLGRIIIGLLAFSSGSQVAVVRGLKITDITTAMATAAYIDIFIDPRLFAGFTENRGRNRRVVFLLMLVLGSFVGAGIGKAANLGVGVLVSGGIKTVVSVMFLFNSKEDNEEEK
ncbi:hypothetical protein DPSP01_007922 [Paraphaeosphaeria sporulosa]|uniref:DUF1275 domain protein n=1 Tax=Paraphaeosphaeria sporulosa TaxID=1460663 RepID=A0A177CKD4_9PLEO|nr:uncharacterized protein CC84DRAFT_1163471 [Paraphaeosphaeria sporulosa]OAG07257.1 hypothetical protein CC84DRAFT_1163471 [Paraphaeosphaeria sporulosa]